jgi:cell division protein ZapA
MPEVTVQIGGRDFQVSCQPGEEHFLRSAATMLDAEAGPITQQMGRLPEAKMLLMAGLMLADRTAAVEDELRSLKARLGEAEAKPAERIEVPMVPQGVVEALAELAARAEAMAAQVEERVA